MRLDQIATLENLAFDIRTIRKALAKAGYSRYKARKKPLLTEAHKAARLAWARAHIGWTDRQWSRVLWTDEASIRCGFFGQVYVTRRADEAFHQDCLIPKFRKYSACMIWGCISAEGVLSLKVFDAGSINGDTYREDIVPLIQKAAQTQQEASIFGQPVIIMQDNASIHKAKATLALFKDKRLILMEWPANSPDLNPIENLWSLLKYRVGLHFPTTREAVITAIQLEWSRITVSDVSRICQSMRQRCEAVIEAEGGHTKW